MNKKIVWYSLATLFAISWIYGLINPKELATGDTPISPLGFTIASLIFIALFTYLGKKAKPSDKFTPSKALHLREKTHLLHNVYEQTISPTVRNKRIFRKLKKLDNYTVIDIETTGLNIYTDTIIEIAAVRVRNGQPVAHFSTFINPHQPLTAKITQITGITDHNLRHAPELKRTLKKFTRFIGKDTIIGHNIIRFDIRMINAALARTNQKELQNKLIDTLPMAQDLYPQWSRHRLLDLIQNFGIADTEEHRALSDALQNARVFEIMKTQLPDV